MNQQTEGNNKVNFISFVAIRFLIQFAAVELQAQSLSMY